jgi:rubrerythrin
MDGKKVYGPYEAVMLGIELEDAGYHFYSRVAEAATDYRIKELFTFLADAEIEHKRVIREEIEPIFQPEWYREEDQQLMHDYLKSVERQPVFPEPDEAEGYAKTEDVGKAIDIGILAEERARDYFAFLRDNTVDEEGKQAFNRLHLEEIKHLHMLQELRKEL